MVAGWANCDLFDSFLAGNHNRYVLLLGPDGSELRFPSQVHIICDLLMDFIEVEVVLPHAGRINLGSQYFLFLLTPAGQDSLLFTKSVDFVFLPSRVLALLPNMFGQSQVVRDETLQAVKALVTVHGAGMAGD